MPPAVLSNALNEFDLALDELASNLEFVRLAGRVRPRLGSMLRWESLDAESKELASKFMKQATADQMVIIRAMVVSLSGAFEHFVRRAVRDCVLAINATNADYDALDAHFRNQNLYRTGMAFQTVYEPLDYLQFEFESLAKNVGSCVTGSKAAALNADAFPIFLSIMSPKNLSEALKRVGLELDWDDLGRDDSMRLVLDTRNTRETAAAIQELLKRFCRIRNQIAHSGNVGAVVTEDDFRQFLAFFRALAHTLAGVIVKGIAKHIEH
jgi:hypothetical protein